MLRLVTKINNLAEVPADAQAHLLESLLRLKVNHQIIQVNKNAVYLNIKRSYSSIKIKPKVFLTRSTMPDAGVNKLKKECEISNWISGYPIPREELLKYVVGKDAIFCTVLDKIDTEVFDRAGPKLKVIGTISVGHDHIDTDECKKRGIRVGYTPDILTDPTAELAIGLLLATARRIVEAHKEVNTGGWNIWSPLWMCGYGIQDSIVGMVGCGRIGLEIVKRIIPFKPSKIIYSSRSDNSKAKDLGVSRCSLNELLSSSDFVIIACSLTPETKEMFNDATFSKMKPTAILINIARGPIIDQNALYNALKNGTIQAAGLDVTVPEPLPVDNPLLTLSNCVILPHIGSAVIKIRQEMSRITACNILAGLKGEKMPSEL